MKDRLRVPLVLEQQAASIIRNDLTRILHDSENSDSEFSLENFVEKLFQNSKIPALLQSIDESYQLPKPVKFRLEIIKTIREKMAEIKRYLTDQVYEHYKRKGTSEAVYETLRRIYGILEGKINNSQSMQRLMEEINKPPDLDYTQLSRLKQGARLEQIGFEKLGGGDSNIFTNDCFTVTLDEAGAPTIEVNLLGNHGSILSIASVMQYDQSRLAVLTAEDGYLREHTSSFSTASGGSGGEDNREVLLENAKKPVSEILLEMGFTLDAENPSNKVQVYTLHSETIIRGRAYETDFKAIVMDGKLIKLVKPVYDRKKIVSTTRIVGKAMRKENVMDEGFDTLQLENNDMLFEISERYGSGRPVPEGTQLKRELTPEELDIKAFESYAEESGFKVGGENDTVTIEKLESINGISIEELETTMRPEKSSSEGFLGKDESLKQVMAEDNEFVLSQGLTHQDLAEPLIYIRQLMEKGIGIGGATPWEFNYKGGRYALKTTSYRGYQNSPFKDDTKTDTDLFIENLGNGKQFNCSFLLADMIQRYGFYEGKGTSYRLDPKDIIEMFDHLKEKAKKRSAQS